MAAIRALVMATSGMACTPKAIPDEQSAPPPDCPVDMRRVEGGGGVASFCFDTYEVTVAAYASCITAGVCTAPIVGDGHGCNHLFGSSAEPINCVESTQAERYCRWRGKRLPDDAEWLWAAHGGARATVYPWGDSSVRVCFDRAKPRGTCQVGSFEDASPEGLHDLVGNVAEWTIVRPRGKSRLRADPRAPFGDSVPVQGPGESRRPPGARDRHGAHRRGRDTGRRPSPGPFRRMRRSSRARAAAAAAHARGLHSFARDGVLVRNRLSAGERQARERSRRRAPNWPR
jgi:formylglycine-generating enzyme required for sulfatase activity